MGAAAASPAACGPAGGGCCRPSCHHGEEELGSEVPGVIPDTSDSLGPRVELLEAAKRGDLEVVRRELRKGADVGAADKAGRTALHVAAAGGHLCVVSALLDSGAEKDKADGRGKSPLLLSVEKNSEEVAELLVHRGCETKPLDKRLLEAAKKGEPEIARILLNVRAKPDARGKDGRTALHHAAFNGHFQLTKLLLERGANKEAESKDKLSPLTSAATNGQLSVVQLLLDKGTRMRNRDRKALGNKLLETVGAGDLEMTKMLLMYEASRDQRGKDGRTPLVIAVEKECFEIARLLVQKGVSKQDSEKLEKFLFDAAESGDSQLVSSLIAVGADFDSSDCFGETPLWKAAAKGHIEVTRTLLDKSAYKEVKSMNCNRTPIMVAIDRGHMSIVKLLLGRRAGLPEPGVLARKLRDAAERGEVARAKALLHCGADAQAADAAKEPPLHKAAAKGMLEVVSLLVGSRANAAFRGGAPARSALSYAVEHERIEVAKFLLDVTRRQNLTDKDAVEKAKALLQRHGHSCG